MAPLASSTAQCSQKKLQCHCHHSRDRPQTPPLPHPGFMFPLSGQPRIPLLPTPRGSPLPSPSEESVSWECSVLRTAAACHPLQPRTALVGITLHKGSKYSTQSLATGDSEPITTPTSWLHLSGHQLFLDIVMVLQITEDAGGWVWLRV